MWQIINSLIPRKTVNSFVKNINVDKFIDHPSDIAEEFNKYFVEIGNSLDKNRENQNNTNYSAYLKNPFLNSIVLEPPTTNEIFYMLLSTNPSKACGCDNISNFFLTFRSICSSTHISYQIKCQVSSAIEVSRLKDWCNANKIQINLQKSFILPISPKLNVSSLNLNLPYGNSKTNSSQICKYLGVLLDDKLNLNLTFSQVS